MQVVFRLLVLSAGHACGTGVMLSHGMLPSSWAPPVGRTASCGREPATSLVAGTMSGPEVDLQHISGSVRCAIASLVRPCRTSRRRRGQPALAPGAVGVHRALAGFDEAAAREAAHGSAVGRRGVPPTADHFRVVSTGLICCTSPSGMLHKSPRLSCQFATFYVMAQLTLSLG